jgi:diaminopimelate epimerase
MELCYTRIDPTKNITLLVHTPVPRHQQGAVAAALLRRNPSAEQVGFRETTADGVPHLQMMGGEFCGNATMSLGAWLCRSEHRTGGELLLSISGAAQPISCSITQVGGDYLGTVTMPAPEKVMLLSLPLASGELTCPVVFLPGICHVIVPADFPRETMSDRIGPWSDLLDAAAVGILRFEEVPHRITPLVRVKKTATSYWEQGCGSGSAAVGAYLAWREGRDTVICVKQPGGNIAVSCRWQGDAFGPLTITGTVRLGADVTEEICIPL